jgi:hypothetical protein
MPAFKNHFTCVKDLEGLIELDLSRNQISFFTTDSEDQGGELPKLLLPHP